MTAEVSIACEAAAELGESPVWDADTDTVLWVDIDRHEVHRYDPATGDDLVVLRADRPIGAVVPAVDGGLVLAIGTGFATWHPATGRIRDVADVGGRGRMNDGKCDPAGRFWAGTMTSDRTPGASALYVLSPAGVASRALDDLTLSNGLGWSPDGSLLYFVDTPLERIDVFDFDPATGALSDRRSLVDLTALRGRPDGLTVDADGRIWVAMAWAGDVRCYSPDGVLEALVELPVPLVTSCAFGGPGITDLYVTSGRWSMTADQLRDHPLAGALFRVTGLGARGSPPARFAGRTVTGDDL